MNTRANNSNRRPGNRHAVVLGGSLAGLLAARILTDHFENVTLIERDEYADTPEARRGIPQANHVHGLLLRGRQVLEELFPGLQDEMIAENAAPSCFVSRVIDGSLRWSAAAANIHPAMKPGSSLSPAVCRFQ